MYDGNRRLLIYQKGSTVHYVMIDQLNDMVVFPAFVQQVQVILEEKQSDQLDAIALFLNLHNFVCFLIFNFLVSISRDANNHGKLSIRRA